MHILFIKYGVYDVNCFIILVIAVWTANLSSALLMYPATYQKISLQLAYVKRL
jgi:hypothetical protein